ncbi:MAG: bifunctional oligoribonuclease/PAP phosphatase NrnA [Pseudomonadota bacterium]
MKSSEGLKAGIKKIASAFLNVDRFLLLSHSNPDGDALGSLLALGQGLGSLQKKTTMFCEGLDPALYGFLPGLGELSATPGRAEDYDAVVLIDCHTLDRVGEKVLGMRDVPLMAVLDHHLAEGPLPELAVVETSAAAAGELVFHLLKELGVRISSDMAMNLFVAISTDTGSFTFDNTSPEALETAAELVRAGARPWEVFRRLYLGRPRGRLQLLGRALREMEYYHQGRLAMMCVTREMMDATGASSFDTDGFVEYPRSVDGVDIAVFIRENGRDTFKVSLRSLGVFNAAALARSFGGGGHFQAAGFSLPGTLESVKEKVITAATAFFPVSGGTSGAD